MGYKKYFLLFVIAALLFTTAQAYSDPVQQWAPTDAAVLNVDTRHPVGGVAAKKISVENFAPDIRFDPRDLDNSVVMLAATFMPVSLPGKRAIDDDTRAAAAALFMSDEIIKRDDNQFDVKGLFKINGRQQPLVFRMNVIAKPGAATPLLIFSGHFNAPVGNMSPSLGLPAQVPITFHVEATPFP